MVREDSEGLLKINEENIRKLANVLTRVEGKDEKECMKDLLSPIKGTMSDRCEIMKKFNHIFGEFRKEYLDKMELTDEEKELVKNLEHHYCFLHVLINLGDDACKQGLVDFDKCTLNEETYAQFH